MSPRTERRRGFVKGRPRAFAPYHSSRKSGVDYVTKSGVLDTDCWEWQRGRRGDGYGFVWHDGRASQAHRVYYERLIGAIPPGMVIDHLCGNPACVNPDHLEPVTNTENVRRGAATRLTMTDARMIRALVAAGFRTVDIARKFEIQSGYVSRIARGEQWAEPAEEAGVAA